MLLRSEDGRFASSDRSMFEHLESRALMTGSAFPDVADLVSVNNTVVRFDTNYGDVYLEVFDAAAPNGATVPTVTANNFLGYVRRGDYEMSFFHRLAFINNDRAQPFVLQGGGFRYENSTEGVRTIPTQPPITNESTTTVPNLARTLSMARTNDPNSASDQFFINLVDNANLNGNGTGYAVFARVANNASWTVIQSIQALEFEDLTTATGFTGAQSGNFQVTPVSATFNAADGVQRNELVLIEDAEIVKAKNVSEYYGQAIYYPEGFAGSTINEFLPIANSRSSTVFYQVIARAEIASGTQILNLGGSTGTFTMQFFSPNQGATTAALAAGISAADLQTALRALSGVGSNVTVTGANGVYAIAFTGSLANTDSFFVLNSGSLTLGTAGVTPNLTKWYRDKVIATGSIAANSRGGITISQFGDSGAARITDLVPQGVPYALEIQSTQVLAANISHYDFGAATGEAFTRTAATTWGFADGQKVTGSSGVTDFLVWQNTTDASATLTIKIVFQEATSPLTFNVTTDQFRRGGLALSDITEIPNNSNFSILITSSQPIVAALTHFDRRTTNDPKGSATIGIDGAGSKTGVLPYGNMGTGAGETIAVFNPNNTSAVVSFTLTFSQAGLQDQQIPAALIIPPLTRKTYNFSSVLTLADGRRYSVVYSSGSSAVYAGWLHSQSFTTVANNADAISNPVGTVAGRTWDFAEGFMDGTGSNPRAGRDIFETVSVYNPNSVFFTGANTTATVTLTLRYTDGFVLTLAPVQVQGGKRYDFDLHAIDQVLQQGISFGRFFYSVQVSSTIEVVAQMRHFDLTLGGLQPSGGFATLGSPIGSVVRLDNLGNG